ncbi:hypothetical protein [Nitrincola sp. MINF-07-Sa-05]|uniref:hypothetical protein n=1 Tax=Nitrincola salilacus TaxID=3400273 RepID=UPI003917F77C
MSKKTPRFVENFVGDYIGNTREEFTQNLTRNMKRAHEFLDMCDSDLSYARKQLELQDSPEARRLWIRTIPPWVEGNLSFLRVTPYLYPPLLDRVPDDVKILFAETILPIHNKSSAKDTVKKTLTGIGKVAGLEISPNLMGETGAQALMNTFETRDGLMHPRSVEGYLVSDENLKLSYDGVDWFNHKFAAVFPPMIEVIKEMIENSSDGI